MPSLNGEKHQEFGHVKQKYENRVSWIKIYSQNARVKITRNEGRRTFFGILEEARIDERFENKELTEFFFKRKRISYG